MNAEAWHRCLARCSFSPARGRQLFKFLAAGLPAFLLAVPMNYAMVEWLHFPKWLSYALVQVWQVTVNFFICRFLVFEKKSTTPLWVEFRIFMAGILGIRGLDWIVYNILVYLTGIYYVIIQIFNVILFAIVKFLFAERVLR